MALRQGYDALEVIGSCQSPGCWLRMTLILNQGREHSVMPRAKFLNAGPRARNWPIIVAVLVACARSMAVPAPAQTQQAPNAKGSPPAKPTRQTLLRGEYGPFRANNDLLYYHLDVRVDPVKQEISGKNLIRFRMLKDDARIQLDLQPALSVDKIVFGNVPLKFEREFGAVFVIFPQTLKAGQV